MSGFRLFRPEAIAFQRDQLHGSAALPVPPSAASLTWLLLAMVCGFGVLLATGDYARKETVVGFLAPTAGVAKIVAARPGLITQVTVAEGQLVSAGAPLLTIQVGETDDRGADVDDAVLHSLQRQRAVLSDQIEREQSKAVSERQQSIDRIAGLGIEAAALQNELVAQQARSQVAEDQVTAVSQLVRQGYVSVVEFKRRQDNYLAQRQNEAALAEQIAAKQGEATLQRHTLDQLPATLGLRVAALQREIAELDGRIAETAGRHAYQLRAPIAGRVSALQARVGLTADTTVALLAIVPNGSALEADLLVPARAIGFVAPGQTVRLAYTAFPFQRFGLHGGHVTTVSSSLLRPNELVAPVTISEPAYRITVALDQQTLTAFGKAFPLGADMTLKADIVFDRRSLLEWLFEPLLSLRGRWL
jgi:membrane fusion protein